MYNTVQYNNTTKYLQYCTQVCRTTSLTPEIKTYHDAAFKWPWYISENLNSSCLVTYTDAAAHSVHLSFRSFFVSLSFTRFISVSLLTLFLQIKKTWWILVNTTCVNSAEMFVSCLRGRFSHRKLNRNESFISKYWYHCWIGSGLWSNPVVTHLDLDFQTSVNVTFTPTCLLKASFYFST